VLRRERASGSIWPTRWTAILPGPVSGTFAVALGMFVVTAVALSVNLARQRDSIGWVQHTDEVLRNISAVEARILEAESGERGYLLTGESSYLDSYDRSQADIPESLAALRRAVSDNPSQIQRLDELRPSIEARLAEFKQIVELGPTRLNEALAMLRTARSRQLMNGLELVAKLRDRRISIPAILMTAHLDENMRKRAAAVGISVVEKPLLANRLLDWVREAFDGHLNSSA
jgi:CHASE3 domain sensor protein